MSIRRLLVVAGFIFSSLVYCDLALCQAAYDVVPDEVLVALKPSSDTPAAANRVAWAVGAPVERISKLHVFRLKLRQGVGLDKAIAAISKHAEVDYVEPNVIYYADSTPNDPSYLSKQYGPQKTQADLAWSMWNPTATAVIAMIDSGIDYTHPDLKNKILKDAAGKVIGFNAVGSNAISGNPTDPLDDDGHGTHCSGIAAAEINNATGIAGIAGWNGLPSSDTSHVKLMPVKVLNSSGSGSSSQIANGITWAVDHGANILSMSFGASSSTTLSNAVAYAWNKGCVICASAGNNSSSGAHYPSGYPNVLSVAATDKTDTLAYYSNYGSKVNVAAPGGQANNIDYIYSTLPSYSGGSWPLGYGGASGTSAAAPHVAGEAALIWSQNPTLTNSQVKNLILTYVDPYIPYSGRTLAAGAGRINVYRALQAAGGGAVVTVPSAPTGLTAAAGDSTIALNWAASTGATSYNVKRSLVAGGPYNQIANVGGTSYSDGGLQNGTAYYYVVTAVNSAGESGNSNEAAATPQQVSANQLLGNPGFENGANGAPWAYTTGIVTSAGGESAHSGSWYVWMGGKGVKHEDNLSQTVTIPATVTKATLTFWVHIDTAETGTSALDLLQIQLRNTSGVLVKQLATMSNLSAAPGYVQKTYDLTTYKGQTLQLFCQGSENAGNQTSFVLDDFALNVQ